MNKLSERRSRATDRRGGPRISQREASEAGGCNFCTGPRPQRVTVVDSPGGFQVRFCSRCLEDLKAHSRLP